MTLKQKLQARLAKSWPVCQSCKIPILMARLEVLPETEFCSAHSQEGRYIGVPIFSHKTAPEVGKVKTDPTADDGLGESVRLLMRGYNRGR